MRCGRTTAAAKIRAAIMRLNVFGASRAGKAVLCSVATVVAASVAAGSRAQSGPLTASCAVIIDNGKATITFTVDNVAGDPIDNVTPGTLVVTTNGTATLSVLTEPKPVRELLGGSSTHFIWRGKVAGVGVIHLSTKVTGDHGGTTDTTGVVACDPVTLGNPARLTPPPTGPIHRPTKTPAAAAGTPSPTSTPVPTNASHSGSHSTPSASSQQSQGTGCAIGPGGRSRWQAAITLLAAIAAWRRRRKR